MSNVINAVFKDSETKVVYTKKMYQHDKGIILRLSGIALPETYKVYFSCGENGDVSVGKEVSGSDISIPDAFFITGKYIYVWICFMQNETGTINNGIGVTDYIVVIPIIPKPIAIDISQEATQLVADLDEDEHALIFRQV